VKRQIRIGGDQADQLRKLRRNLLDVASVSAPQLTWRQPERPTKPRLYPPGKVIGVPVLRHLLTFLEDGVVIIKGTETRGIGIRQDGVEVMPDGTATIAVLEDGV